MMGILILLRQHLYIEAVPLRWILGKNNICGGCGIPLWIMYDFGNFVEILKAWNNSCLQGFRNLSGLAKRPVLVIKISGIDSLWPSGVIWDLELCNHLSEFKHYWFLQAILNDAIRSTRHSENDNTLSWRTLDLVQAYHGKFQTSVEHVKIGHVWTI